MTKPSIASKKPYTCCKTVASVLPFDLQGAGTNDLGLKLAGLRVIHDLLHERTVEIAGLRLVPPNLYDGFLSVVEQLISYELVILVCVCHLPGGDEIGQLVSAVGSLHEMEFDLIGCRCSMSLIISVDHREVIDLQRILRPGIGNNLVWPQKVFQRSEIPQQSVAGTA